MAMENKRIIQLSTERLTLSGDDYVMVDSETDGSAKYRLDRLKETDTTLSVSGMAADAAATGQAIGDEAEAREAADTTLGEDIDDLKSALEADENWYNNQYDVVSNNLFNKELAIIGKTLNTSGQIIDSTSSNYISRKIPVEPSTAYYCNRALVIYSEDGTCLEFRSANDSSNFTTPATAAYVIITSAVSLLDTSTIAKGSNVPYDAYQIAIKKALVRLDKTLSIEGTPADAKAVGDKISETKEASFDFSESIAEAMFLTPVKSGAVILLGDSAINKPKSISTNANKLFRAGINLWDETWELGSYGTGSGLPSYSDTSIRSKNSNPIPVHPETDYYVKSPNNMAFFFYKANGDYLSYTTGWNQKITTPGECYFVRFFVVSQYGTTYNNDIQFTFDSDAEKTIYHVHNTEIVSDADDLTLIPKGQNYIYAVGSTDSISITYYQDISSEYIPKKPYQSGFQIFTVAVNQTIPDLTDTSATAVDNENSMIDVECYIKLPTNYTANGKPTRLLMICHGAGRGVTTDAYGITGWIEIDGYNRIVDAFLNAGYAVMDCNGYKNDQLGTSFWGAPRGVEAWRKAYDYVTREYNVEHDFSIYAFSMGGLTAFELAGTMFPNVRAIAFASPVTSMQDAWNRGNNAAVIKQNYGLPNSVSEFDSSYFKGCDPVQSIVEIGSTEYFIKVPLPPIKVWFGSLEDFPSPTIAQRVVNAIKNANGIAYYREVYGVDHSLCTGGVPAVIPEFVYWINRYNDLGDISE